MSADHDVRLRRGVEKGAKQARWELSQRCRVRLAWSPTVHGGRFRSRQPESIAAKEWAIIAAQLVTQGHDPNQVCRGNAGP